MRTTRNEPGQLEMRTTRNELPVKTLKWGRSEGGGGGELIKTPEGV